MPSNLFVVSESNKRFIDKLPFNNLFSEMVVVHHGVNIRKEKRWDGMNVIAIGGGSVIDTAKIISAMKPCVAIPTTASGAAMTNWAVRWLKKSKVSIKTAQPILCEFYRYLGIVLGGETMKNTYYDCRAHIADSRDSINSTIESLD